MYPNINRFSKCLSVSFCAALCCVFLSACSSDNEMDNRLITTYADVIIVRESTVDSAQSKQRFDSVLQRNGYTKESFENALRDQSQNRARFKTFYDSVVARVKVRRAK